MATESVYSKIVRRRHPEYDAMSPHWDFLEATYRGGKEWFKKHIHQYFKEGPKEYTDRIERAYRFNHTREVVDLVNKYLMRKTPERKLENAPESVQQFWLNADGSGMNINELMRMVSQQSSILGCPWIIVDSVPLDVEENASLKDVEETDASAYAYIIKPQQVMDFAYGEDGYLNWILIEEHYRDDEDPFESSGDILPRFRLWTRKEWFLFTPTRASITLNQQTSRAASQAFNQRVGALQLAYEMDGRGMHGLGRVPAIRADNIISAELYTVPAMINDVAYLDKAIANYLSNLDAIIQDQTFSQLAIPAQNIMPGSGEIDDEGVEGVNPEYQRIVDMGTKRIFVYDGENGQQPFYLSPDPRQAQLILSAIQQMINEIYHSVGLAGERTKQDNAKGIDNSSGVAKSKDFERVNSLLLSKADSLERIENQMCELVMLWAGENPEELTDDLVVYPENFDIQGLFDEFDIADQLQKLQAPTLMRVEQMKRVAAKMFEGRGDAFLKKIETEIDGWGEEMIAAKELETESAQAAIDGARNEQVQGQRQSGTKTRQAKRQKESDQATGQK